MKEIIQGTFVVLLLSVLFSTNSWNQNSDEEPHFWIKTTMTDLTIDVNTPHIPAYPRMEIRLQNDSTSAVFFQGEITGTRDSTFIRFRVDNLSPILWYPHSPNLYHLDFTYYDGDRLLHRKTYRIGFNEFSTRNGQVFLN